jgi:haloacetate dehalogenase
MSNLARRDAIKKAAAMGMAVVTSKAFEISCKASPKVEQTNGTAEFFPLGFKQSQFKASGATINFVIGGGGPPLLLLHGSPQTHIMWRRVAPQLSNRFTVVIPDLRGYGDSSKPPDGENHSGYSKRAMAQDQVELMKSLGFSKFAVVGHDRGGRVAHRLALDHESMTEKIVVLDIVPTYKLFHSVSKEFATVYFHWFFLIQPAPFPETLLGNNAEFYLRNRIFRRLPPGAIDDQVFAEYLRCFSEPDAIHANCEDYRAAATIDLEHDAADLDKKIACPVLALWGQQGAMQPLYDVLGTWKERASNVIGKPIPGGHFLPEESPQVVLEELDKFL